ncbi:unnamed protein product, partial [Allacma fusca]
FHDYRKYATAKDGAQ